ncbi:hypothetical protein PMI07_006400 [Rhizobium sp. CF080]|uniref:hypothetical protein n=1 Tax=Rhizobium sp. (strain CF080) TaxID=1144310 RepID=UPI000271A39E|nr:hypothetical protein [Rhizobium sp. CF080]EUB98086.1 hypothetical protein PMI07_006400 [Rhizobium sp. CF080]
MKDDDELFAEITGQADKAVANTREMDIHALAAALGQRFRHRRVEDIEEQLKAVFRARRLSWRE